MFINFPDKEHLESSHHQYPIPDHGLKHKYNSTFHQLIVQNVHQIIWMHISNKMCLVMSRNGKSWRKERRRVSSTKHRSNKAGGFYKIAGYTVYHKLTKQECEGILLLQLYNWCCDVARMATSHPKFEFIFPWSPRAEFRFLFHCKWESRTKEWKINCDILQATLCTDHAGVGDFSCSVWECLYLNTPASPRPLASCSSSWIWCLSASISLASSSSRSLTACKQYIELQHLYNFLRVQIKYAP